MVEEFVFDERAKAKQIYSSWFSKDTLDIKDMTLVAKYFRHDLGYGDAKTKSSLISFCKDNIPKFNYNPNRNFIDLALRFSRHDYKSKTGITITKKEISDIKKIKDFNSQKILLGMLCIAKNNKTDYFELKNISALKKIAFLNNVSGIQIYELFHKAYRENLLDASRVIVYEPSVKLFFIDTGNENIVKTLKSNDDFYKIGKWYEEYNGGIIGYCSECGSEFIKTGKRASLCEQHRAENDKQRHKKYNKKR